MSRYCTLVLGLLLAAPVLLPALPAHAQPAPVDFNKSIRPLLADRCLHCHGPDSVTRKAGLRLDIEAEAKKTVIVPGKPDESPLLARLITTDPDDIMPPPASKKPALTPEEVATVRQWIAEGAVWPPHWSFAPVKAPAVPAVQDTAWPRNDIDRFVLARLESAGVKPSPEAPREVLLRRLAFDLTGLPPTPAEIDAFVNDASPDAYEKQVDRLLASAHYGERMALDWLDGARYADTNGFQNDFQRQMWPWRDWVIRVLNENMPFDQFTKEQIAGDLLPNATDSQRIGSGFNRNNRATTEGGSIEEEWYIENRIDRVETTATVFLGLTMGCGRCHDHKYDPISQKEFYQFLGFFNGSKDVGFYNETRGNVGPIVSIPSEENKQRLAEFDKRIADAEAALQKEKEASAAGFDAWRAALAAPQTDVPPAPALAMPLRGNLFVAGSALAPRYLGPNGPVWTPGLLGNALELDGTAEAHIDAGEAYVFSADKPFSIALWTRPDAAGSLFSKMDDAARYRGVDILVGEDGKFSLHVVSTWTGDALKVVSEEALPFGAWSQLSVTYDGKRKAKGVAAYLNGHHVKLRTEVDNLNGPIETPQPLRIGRRSASAYFKGAITDFAIFDRDLRGTEVQLLVRARLAEAAGLEATEARTAALQAYYTNAESLAFKQRDRLIAEMRTAKFEYQRDKVPSVMVMEEMEKPRETYRLIRGQYDQPDKSEVLQPAVPAFLPPLPAGAPNNRLGLALWLVDPSNPLTSRVTVNRLWAKFFGEGLVKTLNNLGVQADAPTNPELLDWLAATFMQNGWDLKAFQRMIVTSATYRQRSDYTPELLARDPANTLLARGPRFRLPAELIRDNALAVSGLLAEKIGGPSVKPYQPEGLWAELAGGAGEGPYIQGKGEDLYRRSLYTYRKRTVSHPTVSTFDAPSWEICQVYRARTNTPLQALALLNDTTYVEAARNLAARLLKEAGAEVHDRVRLGFRLVTGRMPSPREESILAEGVQQFLANYREDTAAAEQYTAVGESPLPEGAARPELAAYTAMAQVLLNMDAAITKE